MIRPLMLSSVLLALPAMAEEAPPSTAPDGSAGSAAQLVLAQRTYLHALREGEVLPLIAAIRLARGVTLRPASGWEKTSTGPGEAGVPAAQKGPDPASDMALSIARNLAAEDPDLQDLVYDIDAQLPGGRTVVAVYAESVLGQGHGDTWRLPLFGAVPSELAVIGLDSQPISMRVQDEAGTLVCAFVASPDPKLCRLTPARNEFFTVTVENKGETAAGYRLIGN